MKTKTIIFIIAIIVLIVIGYKMTGNKITGDVINNQINNENTITENKMSIKEPTKVKLQTNLGDIVIELREDMPITAGNFENLVKQGIYDGVIFHRIIPDVMIQGGDPTGTGMGDPSIPKIQDEFVEGSSNLRGTISMANAGPNTGSSQFFINLIDNTSLDWDKPPMQSKHPVFGKVIEGMDIVDKIAKVQIGAGDKPIEKVKIIKAEIIS